MWLRHHTNPALYARREPEKDVLYRVVAANVESFAAAAHNADAAGLPRHVKRELYDGTTHLAFEPLVFLDRLAALVPPPKSHTVIYTGVLSSHAPRRPAVRTSRSSGIPIRSRWCLPS